MKLKLLPLLLLVFAANAQTPVFHWAKKAGSAGFDTGIDITTDAQENVITVGSFNSDTDFDPGPGSFILSAMGNNDGFIQKLDKQGNFIWAKQISGTMIESIHKVALDAGGNIYLAGEYNATVDFNPGPATFNLTSTTHTIPSLKSIDVYVVKLDPNGNFLWAKSFGGAEYDAIADMEIDVHGNIILGGYFGLSPDFDPGTATVNITSAGMNDIYITKLDSNGNFIWTKRIGGTGDEHVNNMVLDASGNIYATGYFYGPVDFNPGAGIFTLLGSAPDQLNGQLQDVYVTKLNNDGNFIWASKFGGPQSELGYALAVDSNENVYCSGVFFGMADFDPGTADYNLDSVFSSMYLAKLDSNGQFGWAKKISGTGLVEPRRMQFDTEGNLFINGLYSNTVSFGLSPEFELTSTTVNTPDVFIAKFAASGDALWVKSIGGTGEDDIYGMTITSEGSVYTSGSFSETADFNPDAATFNMTSAGSGDMFVSRLSPETLAIHGSETDMQVVAYPNPSSGIINISIPSWSIGAKAIIYDMAGRKIVEKQLLSVTNQTYLTSGIYLIEVSLNAQKKTLKIVVN
jgi:hypothetical protein